MTSATESRLRVVEALRAHCGLELTSRQREVVEELKSWCLGPGDGSQAVLSGFAGTGKTTILQVLVLELLCVGAEDWDIWVTAPTHKAAKVLKSKLDEWQGLAPGPSPEPCTIHSALGLKPKRTLPHEPEAFVEGLPRFRAGDLLIVDECSMVGSELHRLILQAALDFGCRVLFTGDPKQLQPVNERRISRTFDATPHWALTDVLRHGGPILALATAVRTMPRGGLPQVRSRGEGRSRVVAHPGFEALEVAWREALAQRSDEVVFLCWTNKLRREFNKRARVELYGPDVPDFMEGDRLVVLRAFERGGQVVLYNNDELEVKSAQFTQLQPLAERDWSYDCWHIKPVNAEAVYVLADSAVKQHKAHVQALGKEVKEENEKAKATYEYAVKQAKKLFPGISGRELWDHPLVYDARLEAEKAKRRWSEEYFRLKDFFAEVDFGYAITIHKSQGSTYKSVFVCDDYMKARDERLQLLYVAVTRAAEEVHHVEL